MDGELVPGGRDEDLKGKGGVDVRGGGAYTRRQMPLRIMRPDMMVLK